jgi:hypothetical protein
LVLTGDGAVVGIDTDLKTSVRRRAEPEELFGVVKW